MYISAILREQRKIASHRKRKEWSWQREQSRERSENFTSFTCNSSLLLCLHIHNVSVPPHYSFWTKEPRYLSTQCSYHIVEKLPRPFFSLVFNSMNAYPVLLFITSALSPKIFFISKYANTKFSLSLANLESTVLRKFFNLQAVVTSSGHRRKWPEPLKQLLENFAYDVIPRLCSTLESIGDLYKLLTFCLPPLEILG